MAIILEGGIILSNQSLEIQAVFVDRYIGKILKRTQSTETTFFLAVTRILSYNI